MRSLVAGLVVLSAVSTASDVRADVGPAPKCPEGTYSAYLYGRRCVKNGYVLRQNAQGQVEQVPDGPTEKPTAPLIVDEAAPVTPPKPSAAPPAAAAASTPPPAEKKAGGCQTTDRSSGAASTLGMFAAVGLLLLARRRRDPAVATNGISAR